VTRFYKHTDHAFAGIRVHRILRAPGATPCKDRHACSFFSSSGRCGERQADYGVGKYANAGVSVQVARQHFSVGIRHPLIQKQTGISVVNWLEFVLHQATGLPEYLTGEFRNQEAVTSTQ
jgi:hypothetical protein